MACARSFSATAGPRAALRSTRRAARPARIAAAAGRVVADGAQMQFIEGVSESCVPEVRLTRSKAGSSGTATFIFNEPDILLGDVAGDITGLTMLDEEGSFNTTDVKAKFVNGKPQNVEAKYVMRSTFEWDRFMRFMDRYAESNGLEFQGKGA
mmetsp:Transcript_17267/g.56498  ORF Transcript_17267/g.56498 Transcript_17267/m.56498 type:complete len:153 (+) Transcript_17267:18-476(+)